MTNTTTYQSSVARNSGRALQCGPSAANYEQITGLTHTVDVPTYARFYLRISSAPSTTLQIWAWRLNGVVAADISLLGNRTLQLNAPATGVIGTSFALTVDTWYRVETSITIPASGNGSLELRIDGVTQTSGAANVGTTLTTTTHRIGHVTAGETATTLYYDDLAINDGTGANQNTWPGPGNVTLLKPTSDNTKGTGWEGPQTTGSDTTDLYQNVDNVPPTGVAHSDVDANAGMYAFNAANLGAASDFRVNCQSMSDAGLPSTAIPVLSQAYMRASCNSTTGTNNMELQGITPSDSAVTCNVEATAVAGTEPTGWKSFRTVYTSGPSLSYSTNPVIEATKILTGSTRAHMVDQMGLLVEWITPLERSAALDAAGAIASSGEFETPVAVVERSASLSATAAIAADQERDLLRSASVSATGAVTADHERDLLRFAAVSATGAIASSGVRVHERSVSTSATASITASHERELLRSSATSATAEITASGEIQGGVVSHERSAAVAATAAIDSAGTFYSTLERSTSVSATAAIQAEFERDLIRSASASAIASISSSPQRELLRAAQLAATGNISATPQRDLIRSATITAAALIESSGAKFEAMTYAGGSVSTYSGGTAISYAAATTSSYGSDEDWTYGDTPTYTYGG
jgi:hypothetical protein